MREAIERQRHAVAHWLSPGKGRVHFTQAPPGTGKTRIAAACIAAALDRQPDSAVVATAMSNLPVTKLVIESARAGIDVDMVAFFSGTACVKYNEQINELENYLLEAKVKGESYRNKLMASERRDVEQYLKDIGPRPRHAKEKAVAEVLLTRNFQRVVFATTYMAAAIHNTHFNYASRN